MSSAPGLRRRSIAEVVVEELEKREINPIDERSEPFSSQNATSVPVEAGQLEAVLRHLVSSGMVPFTLGFAMHKARVFEPKVIQDLFLMRDFTMMSMFLGAVATSQLIFSAFNSIPENSSSPVLRYLGTHFRRVKSAYQTARNSQRGTVSSAAGAAMLGAGMTLAGACPGTIFVAVGNGVVGSEAVIAGGLLGVSVFTALERKVLSDLFQRSKVAEPRLEKVLADEKSGAWYANYSKLALVSSLAMGAAAVAFNKFAPNTRPYDLSGISSLVSALKAPAWNPVIAGMVMGSLQIPMFLFGDSFLGTSTQFVSLIAPLAPLFQKLGLADKSSEVSKFAPIVSLKTVLGGWGFLASLVAGAYTSASISGTLGKIPGLLAATNGPTLVLSKAHPLVQPVVAGMLLWFGARTALGCTSGHGISGFSLLSINSIVAVASMFGAGIAVAQTLKMFV